MSTEAATVHEREPSPLEWEWVMRKLGKRDLLDGVTNRDKRVARWRAEILRRGWGFANTAAGKRSDGTVETWEALFMRATGEPLQPTSAVDRVRVDVPIKNGGATA